MGSCYDRKTDAIEKEYDNKMLKTGLGKKEISDIFPQIIDKSEKINDNYIISKENLLAILSAYFKEDKEFYEKLYVNLIEEIIKSQSKLLTRWVLYSLIIHLNNTYDEIIEYFIKIIFIKELKDLNSNVNIPEETTVNIQFINMILQDYLWVNLIGYFEAFMIALNTNDQEMLKGIEVWKTRVFISENIKSFIGKMFNDSNFSKNWETVMNLQEFKAFLMKNHYCFKFHELKGLFIKQYE